MPATWELSPANPDAGDETPLLILDRQDGPEGRTICIIPGRLSQRATDGDFVRLLDEHDLKNAMAILFLPQLRSVLAELIEWAARSGGWDAPCWRTAQELLWQIRSASADDKPSLPLDRKDIIMRRNADYAVVRLRDGAYRLDRMTEPGLGPVANITPIRDKAGKPVGWRLRPLLVMRGSKSKIWSTPAEVVASTKLMSPGQARSAVAAADAAGAS